MYNPKPNKISIFIVSLNIKNKMLSYSQAFMTLTTLCLDSISIETTNGEPTNLNLDLDRCAARNFNKSSTIVYI